MHANAGLRTAITVQRVPDLAALTTLISEWECINQHITPRTPFTSPSWIIPWWEHFWRRHGLFRDELFCHIIRDADGRLVAVAPLMRTYMPGFGLPVIRMVQFFGTDPSLTEIRGVICRPEDHDRVINALMVHFRRCRGEWDVFRWNGLRRPVSTYSSSIPPCEFVARRDLPDYIIELPGSWDELKAHVSSNMRKNLRKAYEFLERDGFRFVLHVVERPGDVQAAIGRFLSLHAARSEAADMINHPNKFARPHAWAFLSEYLHRIAEKGELRIFELEIGGVVVASRLAFLFETDLYMYYAGYDPTWKNYSVMTVLVSEMIKWAFAHGVRRVNLSTGHDQSKMRWKPFEIVFHDAVQVSPTRRGRVGFRAFRGYEALFRIRVRFGI